MPSTLPYDIAAKSTQSAFWLYGQKFVLRLLGFLSVAVLARQLDPADFGLVAIANVLVTFATFVGLNTVGPFVTQDHEDGWEQRAQSAFWLNMTVAAGLLVVSLALFPFVSRFYEEPLLQPVLGVIVLTFFLSQLTVVPDSLLRRGFDYRKLILRNLSFQFLSVVFSILMALKGGGVWSLVLPDLLLAVPRFLVISSLSHWRPSLRMRLDLWKGIFSYTKHVIGTSVLGNILNDGDTLVIGKTLGNQLLGFYDRAWNTANLVTSNVSGVVSDIALPALAAYQRSGPELLGRAYQKMLLLLSILTMPVLVLMFVLADDVILALYGDKWLPAIPILRILIVVGMQRSLFTSTGVVFYITGRPDLGFKLNLVQTPLYLLSIFIGSLYGIMGVAVSVTIIRTLFAFAAFYHVCRLIKLPFIPALRSLRPTVEVSFLVGLSVFVLRRLGEAYFALPPVLDLLLWSALGGLVFLALLVVQYTPLLNELLKVMERLSGPAAMGLRSWLRYPRKST